MSISGLLDSENSYESSSTAKLDDFVKEAHDKGVESTAVHDSQKYDKKEALKSSLDGSSSLTAAIDEQKKEIVKQSEALKEL